MLLRKTLHALYGQEDYLTVPRAHIVTSAAFWKLREVSLTYDIPVKNILGGLIKDAQIGIVGRNLMMLRPRTNIWTDPEFNAERNQQCCWLYY